MRPLFLQVCGEEIQARMRNGNQRSCESCQRLEQPLASPGCILRHGKRLAASAEQADHQADTGGDADGFPWIFVDISIGSLDCLFGFDKQCRL